MEIEAKFAVPDRDTYRRLAQLSELAGYRLVPRQAGQVADRYFDTADGRLRRGGFACRLRAEGDQIVATLKGLGRAEGAVHRRAEEEVRLPTWNPDPTTWPAGPARALALQLSQGAMLAPLFDLTQRRIRRDLFDGERLVAQLSLDFVRLNLTGLRRPVRSAYYELEVELAGDGSEADLATVVAELSEKWGLQPEPRSKFERGLEQLEARRAAVELGLTAEERRALAERAAEDTPTGRHAAAVLAWDEGLPTAEIARRCDLSPERVRYWVRAFRRRRLGILAEAAARLPKAAPASAPAAPQAPPGVRIGPFVLTAPTPIAPDDPMAEAGRKVLSIHFGRMLANEEGTRLGEDPEALHDMRVATRRMRAALALFAPYYKPKVLKPLGKGLRRTGRTLGAVRDLDVLIGKARTYGERLMSEGHGDLTPLLEAWTATREEARGRMLAYLDGPAYRRFVAGFTAFLVAPAAPAASPTASDQVRHVVPRLILERYEVVRSFERLLPDGDLATYHALRIECKGLRYALEFFREVLGPETPALIKQVTAMQDLLGELQDARVAEQLLTSFLEEAPATADLTGVKTYLAAQQSRQRELLAAFPAPWADLVGPDFRRRLALAIAAL